MAKKMAKKKTTKKAVAKKAPVKKKAAKKTVAAAKKAPAKKKASSKKAPEKKICRKVSGDSMFFVIDGSTISSACELADAFDRMSDDVFFYHVTEDRHDFASWVREVLAEVELAEKLVEARSPLKAEVVVLRHMLGE